MTREEIRQILDDAEAAITKSFNSSGKIKGIQIDLSWNADGRVNIDVSARVTEEIELEVVIWDETVLRDDGTQVFS